MEIKEMAEIIEKFRKFIEEKKIEGATVRRVSMNARGDPSITISKELKKIGLEPRDWVVVYVEDNRIIIEKL